MKMIKLCIFYDFKIILQFKLKNDLFLKKGSKKIKIR